MLIESETTTVAQDVFIPSILEDFWVVIWRCKEGSANSEAGTTKLSRQTTPKMPVYLSSRAGEEENSSVFTSLLATHQPNSTWERNIHIPVGEMSAGRAIDQQWFPRLIIICIAWKMGVICCCKSSLRSCQSVPQGLSEGEAQQCWCETRHQAPCIFPVQHHFFLNSSHFTFFSSYSSCSGSALVHLDLQPSGHCPSISFFFIGLTKVLS